jgi:hypothetical protein
MAPGYHRDREAASITLRWLKERFEVDPVIAEAIGSVLARWREHGPGRVNEELRRLRPGPRPADRDRDRGWGWG